MESFWAVYVHLKRPSTLPSVSDYHIFRKGIRPVWEDEENKRGGKWIIRLKKGVSDRYWEDLLFAIVGDQFAEAGEEVCGAVLSVRSGEDVLSVWTRIDGGRNIKIRYVLTAILHSSDKPANLHFLVRQSSAFWPSRPIRISFGKVTTIVLHNDPPSTKHVMRRAGLAMPRSKEGKQ